MQKARVSRYLKKIIGLRPLVSYWFQVLFHSPHWGSFSPFPHGTSSLSVINEYLALVEWSPQIQHGVHVSGLLRCQSGGSSFRIRDYHPVSSTFQRCSARFCRAFDWSYNPEARDFGLGFSRFARRYSGNLI